MSERQQINDFATHLRKIEGLRLFKIFSKYYKGYDRIDVVFNLVAEKEAEAELRELEHMWYEFILEKVVKEKDD